MQTPVLKVVSDQGCQCYIIGCRDSGKAMLVDPKVGRRSVIQDLLGHYGLTVQYVLDTHTHADHLSDSLAWMQGGAELLMSCHSTCARPMQRLEHGQSVQLGELSFTALEVPGHTPDCLALYGHGMVITGDSLFIGGLARADFTGSDPEQMFENVCDRLLSLPDKTLVFPGHGYNDILFSTIAKEKETNQALAHASGVEYAQKLGAVIGRGNTPAVDLNLEMNVAANPDLPDEPKNVATCCAAGAGGNLARARELGPADLVGERAKIVAREAWIDVRDPYEFAASHVPGATSIPMSEMGFHLDLLAPREPVVLQCKAGVRSMTAARTLIHLGVAQDPVSLAGGFDRWQEEGHPIER